jgi:CheY-like chemotaxis protein
VQKLAALIVDDNFFNRQIFNIALDSVGYQVTESDSGEKGLELIEKSRYHLLILDLQMPTMDGRTVLRKLRDGNHAKMHIIVITANAHMATDDINDLADYVMFKPINVTEFSEFARRLKDLPLQDNDPV